MMVMVPVVVAMAARTVFLFGFALGLTVLVMGQAFLVRAATRSVCRLRFVHAAVVLLRCHRAVVMMRRVSVSARFVVRVIVTGCCAVVFHTLGDGANPLLLQRTLWMRLRYSGNAPNGCGKEVPPAHRSLSFMAPLERQTQRDQDSIW